MGRFLLPRDARAQVASRIRRGEDVSTGVTEKQTDRQPTKETAMRVTSGKASRAHHIVCPFCESGELVSVGSGFARCGSCGLPLLGSALETLRDIIDLPDALGTQPC